MTEDMYRGLYGALAKAQGEFPPIHKDKTVSVKTRTGGGYSYDYADLATILKAVTPVLSKHEIAVIQRLQDGVVETMLIHSSGESISSSTPIPVSGTNHHDIAGGYTFFRRHALTALLGIAADDDTNHAATMTSDNQPVDTVEISGGEDPLAFLDDNVPASLDACQTIEDLTQHLSRYQPKDAEAVTAAKQRITNQKEAA